MEEVAGVQGALQGKQGFSGMSASLYAQQTQNASVSLLDVLDSFSSFVTDSAYKKVKNIQQFYDSKRVISIAGSKGKTMEYDPNRVRDVEFDMAIVESTNSPVYRMLANDLLMEIWKTGQISIEQLLENGSFPFADQLLQSIKSQKEQLAQGQTPQALPPQLQQQIDAGTNPQALEMLGKSNIGQI